MTSKQERIKAYLSASLCLISVYEQNVTSCCHIKPDSGPAIKESIVVTDKDINLLDAQKSFYGNKAEHIWS